MDHSSHHTHNDHAHHGGGLSGLKDPVCSMPVTEQSPHHMEYGGKPYYFCSAGCKGKFAANPQQYVHAPSADTVVGTVVPAAIGTVYTCPMHPEVRQDHPGNCPKCGMTLEPILPSLEDDENPELRDFTRRFWWTLPLTAVVFVLAMFGHRLQWMDMARQSWVELVLAVPIVLWGGWPFFQRGWASLVQRHLNMFTLIAIGTGVAWIYSLVAALASLSSMRSSFAISFTFSRTFASGVRRSGERSGKARLS